MLYPFRQRWRNWRRIWWHWTPPMSPPGSGTAGPGVGGGSGRESGILSQSLLETNWRQCRWQSSSPPQSSRGKTVQEEDGNPTCHHNCHFQHATCQGNYQCCLGWQPSQCAAQTLLMPSRFSGALRPFWQSFRYTQQPASTWEWHKPQPAKQPAERTASHRIHSCKIWMFLLLVGGWLWDGAAFSLWVLACHCQGHPDPTPVSLAFSWGLTAVLLRQWILMAMLSFAWQHVWRMLLLVLLKD